jgi:uncharacterized membrane protein YkgB
MQISNKKQHFSLHSSSENLSALLAWQPTSASLTVYFSILNGIYLCWIALLIVVGDGSKDVLRWWGQSALWGSLLGDLSMQAVVFTAVGANLFAGLCLLLFWLSRVRAAGAIVASLIYCFNLLYFFTNPVWRESMGGFPFLGSGQSIVKYVPMLATTLFIVGESFERPGFGTPRKVALSGIVLVMGWIGAMKFFMFEAEGIEPLLRNHLLFSWMYQIWTLQGVSNVIGTLELAFALLVVLSVWQRQLAIPAVAGIGITVACTTSFIFTLPAWDNTRHFPLINSAGLFLIKDQFLFAATLLLLHTTSSKPILSPEYRQQVHEFADRSD